MTRVVAFDHIVLRSPDIERSLRFYTEALGLEALRVAEWRAGKKRFPSVRVTADTLIDFFPQETAGAEPAAQRLDHYCMVVPPGELDAVLEQVRAFGIEPGPVQSRWGAHGDGFSSYLTTPEGMTLELRHYPG
jgi:catechol 2,3-dioxygenase-like lactoylglutathione lyase family enzyme